MWFKTISADQGVSENEEATAQADLFVSLRRESKGLAGAKSRFLDAGTAKKARNVVSGNFQIHPK